MRHHDTTYPNNALVAVRGIVLDRSTSPPTVAGGSLFERQPWDIRAEALKAISYKYSVPDDSYADDGFDAVDLSRAAHETQEI